MVHSNRILLIPFLLLLTACQMLDYKDDGGPASAGDAAAIENLRTSLVRALMNNDPPGAAALFTEHCVWMDMDPKERALQGRSAVQAWLESLQDLPPVQNLVLTSAGRYGANGLVYDWGTVSYTLQDIMSGKTREEKGSYLMVLLKSPDNVWRTSALIYS